jgi:nucleoid DNA-binding protein
MTKTEFIAAVAKRSGLTVVEAERIVGNTFDEIAKAIAAGSTVNIHGFGTFGVRSIPGKRGKCPKTGEPYWRPGRRAPHFRSGQALDALLDA